MCGIFGFVGRTPEAERLMPFLAWEMDNRGRDSWGVTDGLRVYRRMGSILMGFVMPTWGESLIFHTRAASVGSKCLANQHPFIFPKFSETTPSEKYSTIVGVHNGGVYNHEDLNKKYNRNFAVDSMHVFANIASGLPTSEIAGYGALAWFETIHQPVEPRIHFATFNMMDFHAFKLVCGSIVFCSTKYPVVDAAAMCRVPIAMEYDLKQEYLYSVEYTENEGIRNYQLMRGERMVFGARNKIQSYEEPWRDRGDWCPKCYAYICKCNDSFKGSFKNKDLVVTNKRGIDTLTKTFEQIIDPSRIGHISREQNQCMHCKVVKINREHEVLCGLCLKDLENRGGDYVYL